MANTPSLPNPESYEQLLSDMLSAYASKTGTNDFNVGSVITSLFEVVALATARSSGDLFQILRDFSVDRATGDTLKRLATENNVQPITAKPATGTVSIFDTSFTKISTKVYAGSNPPNIGSVTINVSDASLFPSTGSIYIGRGTPNVEGPIAYTAVTQVGGFYAITLSVPTTKYHNIGEAVILAQGGVRTIQTNVVVVSPGIGSSADIQYGVNIAALILDGETQVDNVQITALTPGSAGNVPIGAISKFTSPPFSGATVKNQLPLTTGLDNETDDQLRVRIKRAQASIGLGTATAVEAAVIGATPSDEQASIVSDSIVLDTSGNATLYIDDGTGYEAKSSGIGLESIIDSALGGEQFFQLSTGGRQAPVAKAFLQSTLSAPFDIIGGDTLALLVGGVTYQHTFATLDFLSPGGATAFEITASVNANTTLGFEATTAGGGTLVVFRAKAETGDSIQTTTPTTNGRDASILLGLPSNEIQTLRLYKNDIPLSKDGSTASVFTQNQQLWSSSVQNGDTLILSVDGTSAITYTMLDADFISTGLYSSVSASNSLAAWVQVFNAKLTGVTASVVGQQIELTSNLGVNVRAKIAIDAASSLVTKGMFSSVLGLAANGADSDYTLNRNTAQFELATPLVAGDKLSAGSTQTQARIETAQIAGGSITFASDAHLWLLIDDAGTIIPSSLIANTLFNVSKPATNTVRYTSAISTAFVNVQVGDYVIVWSPDVVAANRLEGRVHARTNSSFDLLVTSTEYASAVVVTGAIYTEGIVFVRSDKAPQKFKVAAGTYSLDQVAQVLNAQTPSATFTVITEEFLNVATNTKDSTGALLIVTADAQGGLMNFAAGAFSTSQTSLIAFYDSQESFGDFPLFIHSSFSSEGSADPIDSFINSINSAFSLAGRDPNELLSMLQPYGTIEDAQAFGEIVQESEITGSTVGLVDESLIRRLRIGDRYYLANPLDFGSADTAVAIVDNDTTNKSFSIPLYRRAITNTVVASNPNNFNAYDVDSGASANFASAFGSTFDFSNFKVLMQAKKTLKPAAPKTALLYRSTKWGRSGEKLLVSYVYPSVPNSPITNTVIVNELINIEIALKSGATAPTSIDNTTEWTVTIVAHNPVTGIDQVTYSYAGGTAPAMSLSGGEYVNITEVTELNPANVGIFRVSTQSGFAPTSTSFTVQRPTGVAVAESNKATVANGAISFYLSAATTAADVNTYVNANLSQYLTSAIVPDGGTDGSGVIVLSTYEDSGFTAQTVQLKDGINWLASSSLASSPNFVFKVPLTLPTDVGYAFNNGEEIRLIPTTPEQVKRFISVLAVTGFTTVGEVELVDRATRLELSTNTLGSLGSIQIIGGLANQYETPVLGSAARIDNNLMSISANAVASQGVHSDQWFRLQAANAQAKEALLSSNTSVSVVGNSPTTGESTMTLAGRTLTQRYFGKPRHNVRPVGQTFRIEKQGNLVCLSWNGSGSNPAFVKSALNFNDSAGGTLNAVKVTGTLEIQFVILTGNANFNELSIGDFVTISGMPTAANNGTFSVTGVSDDGRTLQILNPNSANQFSSGTFTFTGNSTAGDAFTIGTHTLIAGTDFTIAGSQQLTAANLSAVIGTLPNVTSSVNGSVVTVTATSVGASVALSYAGSAVITVSGASLTGTAFSAGAFTASSGVSEGDTLLITDSFSILNQGKFRVIRQFNNSVWFENANVIEEEATLAANNIGLGFDSTTSFSVSATSHTQRVTWNQVGTEPSLQNAQAGDLVTFGTDFSATNRGTFSVLRSGQKLPQIAVLTIPSGAQFATTGVGTYFKITSAGNVNQYYVWFNINGGNSDPAPGGGFTGIEVDLLSGDNATQAAIKVAAVLNVATGLSATSSTNTVTVTTIGAQNTTAPFNVNVPSPFAVTVNQAGQTTFLECINPSAVNQSTVFVSDVLTCVRPQMKFFEYEATVPGDIIVVAGAILSSANAGRYPVVRVIDRDHVIVSGVMVTTANTSLNGFETSIFVQEGVPYTGYKQVLFAVSDPDTATRNLLVFDTNAQSEKIDEAAGVQLVSLSKMNFNTTPRIGLDSYRYNTGLIAEANRIVYGDPRDPVTYAGVGAAGANIFVKEPLARRVQVSVVVRLVTGVPFTATAQQIRNSVSYLIKSNPVGTSIAISSIVAAINAIPGVRAVSISSPLYDASNDLIFIAPAEKAVIIDPSLDINVSQVGV